MGRESGYQRGGNLRQAYNKSNNNNHNNYNNRKLVVCYVCGEAGHIIKGEISGRLITNLIIIIIIIMGVRQKM